MFSIKGPNKEGIKYHKFLDPFSDKNSKKNSRIVLIRIILIFVIINLIMSFNITHHRIQDTELIDMKSDSMSISCVDGSIFASSNSLFDTYSFVKSIKKTVPALNGFDVFDAYEHKGLEYDKNDNSNMLSLNYWGDVSEDNYGGGISYHNNDYHTFVYMEKKTDVDRLRIQIDKLYRKDEWYTYILEVKVSENFMNIGYRRLPCDHLYFPYDANTKYIYGKFEISLDNNVSKITYAPNQSDSVYSDEPVLLTNENTKEFYTNTEEFLKYASQEIPELLDCYDLACKQFNIDGKKYLDISNINSFFTDTYMATKHSNNN